MAVDGILKGAVHKGKFIKMVVRKSLKKDDLLKEKGAIDKDIAKFRKEDVSVEQMQKLLEKCESVFVQVEQDWHMVEESHIMGVLDI